MNRLNIILFFLSVSISVCAQDNIAYEDSVAGVELNEVVIQKRKIGNYKDSGTENRFTINLDFDLRLLLMRYFNRIKIAFKTSLIYNLSNKYNSTTIWFVDNSVVSRVYARDFDRKVYNLDFKRNPVIHRHHLKNPNDRFAPSWKTLEFMTIGAVMKLYEQLKECDDKIFITQEFCIRQVVIFELRSPLIWVISHFFSLFTYPSIHHELDS